MFDDAQKTSHGCSWCRWVKRDVGWLFVEQEEQTDIKWVLVEDKLAVVGGGSTGKRVGSDGFNSKPRCKRTPKEVQHAAPARTVI